jgi:hypothetical protein
VAVWEGRVYVAAVDGRLFALDAGTGAKVWEVDTIVDHGQQYSSTGAPQIAGHAVVIGNGGGDMGVGGVRGYVSAYDLNSGELKWRFYTVPGAPGAPFEHPELEAAAKTWDPQRNPQYRGGGTVWDGMAYDPDLNLVYIGTGNSAPYDSRQRGRKPQDNLYVASILALNADTGRLAWYYQVGLRRGAEIRAGHADDRRQGAQGADASQQERLFLRARPRQRQAVLGQEFRHRHVGFTRGPENRTPGTHARCRIPSRTAADLAQRAGCTHLAADVVQPGDRPGLHSRQRGAQPLRGPGTQRRQHRFSGRILHD